VILGADPLLNEDLGFAVVAIVVVKTVVVFAFLLIATLFMIWFERKIIGDMQNRIGPNRAGPFGLFQSLADGIKVFFKEDLVPDRSDRTVFKLAPYLSVVPAFLTFAVVPIGGDFSDGNGGIVHIFGHDTRLQLADPPMGILLVLAMSSVAVYGVMLAGWSSGSKYPLLGAVRASAQMVSYEAALGLAVVTVVLVAGTLTTSSIVNEQGGGPWDWNLVVTGLVPFVVFLIAATAELNRPPFDLVEAEQELVGGFHTEYSSVRFALFYLAEFMSTVTMSAIIVTLFLGGPNGPAPIGPGWVWGMGWFFLKLLVFLFIFVWFRATLPRFRYDQLMDLGWKALIPTALGWLLLIVALRVGEEEDWNPVIVAVGAAVVLMAGYGLLVVALRAARRHEAVEGVGFH
jgi:NADH-quinone oxidoreductase subunit H